VPGPPPLQQAENQTYLFQGPKPGDGTDGMAQSYDARRTPVVTVRARLIVQG